MANMNNSELPGAEDEPVYHLRQAYDEIYQSDPRITEDSPLESRLVMARRVAEALVRSEITHQVILDLGAGPQSVERSMEMMARSSQGSVTGRFGTLAARMAASSIVTLDVAAIPTQRFPRRQIAGAQHLRADSQALPFADKTVDVAFSNMSLDMLRATPDAYMTALTEVRRVLKPDGLFLANFHHADLCEDLRSQYAYEPPSKHVAAYYDAARPNPYYDNWLSIVKELSQVGLSAEVQLETESVGHEKWWAVQASLRPQDQLASGPTASA